MKLGDFLNNQAQKCNKQNEPALIKLLSNSEFANMEIDDNFASAMDNELMSLDAAKNNYLLKSHFTAQALNSVDSRILNMATELGLEEDVVNQIKANKNTYGNLDTLREVIKCKLQGGNGTEPDPTKVESYNQKINELNSIIAGLKDTHSAEISEIKKGHEQEITDFMIGELLMGQSYANKELSPEDQRAIAETLFKKELEKKSVMVVRDGNVLKLRQKDNPELDYFENNRPVNTGDFITKMLADKKMLAVSGGSESTPNTPSSIPSFTTSGGKQLDTSSFDHKQRVALGENMN